MKKLINNKFIPDKAVGTTSTSLTNNNKDETILEEEENNKIIINEMVEIIEHAPVAFHQIREWDGITDDSIKESLHPDNNRD